MTSYAGIDKLKPKVKYVTLLIQLGFKSTAVENTINLNTSH